MAVHRPNPAHLRAQLQSLAEQTHPSIRLICVIADGGSGRSVSELAQDVGLSATVVEPGESLDAVRAFEAGLAEALDLVPDENALFALCDQDDVWHPDRLARGIAALDESGADLVHSDARLVAEDGATVLHRSMLDYERRHRRPGLRGLLYRNNVTGMTTLMRRRLVDLALPFPPQSGVHFYHDLWLALLASALGGVHLIRSPLVDYRQHGENAIGAVDRQAGWLRPGLLARVRQADGMWLRREAASYGLARYLAHSLYARLADAVEDGRLPRGQAQLAPLRPFLARFGGLFALSWDGLRLLATGHAGLARIALGFSVVSLGRNTWILKQALGPGLEEARGAMDARLYSLSPGVPPPAPRHHAPASDTRKRRVAAASLVDTRKTPSWRPKFGDHAPAVTVLVPTLNPTEVFAGISTAIDMGLGLAERGLRVRFVATDLPVSSMVTSRRFVLGRLSSAEAQARVTLHCGVKGGTVPAHHADRFLATAWWSAHVADRLIRDHGYVQDRFAYLIQDFEPAFYPWGPEYADAMSSYELDFIPVFNTSQLRDHFAQEGFAFATPDAISFHPAIDIGRYAGGTRPERKNRPPRLALYGRPEVPRNMYATAIEVLSQFVESEGLGPEDIEIVSVGLRHDPVTLPGGVVLRSLGKLPWEDYPAYLLEVELGLSLMYSPHPSHPPIEMAASGVRVVTNRFGPKDLSLLSPAILSAPPTVPGLVQALRRAWGMGPVPDGDRWIELGRLGLPPEAALDRLAPLVAPQPAHAKG
ncbi:glycosyl transferase family 1 [Rhodosalinus halophilus]|uniref:Glycosyl transferase family 1 n=2 Tax=Rhodosalinus halophilus TaxID=2259333 RepID=A0A365U7N0_9RHOB|nr:glycosyl transferase family 1 [Rhodosalinus halophilus]